MASLQGCPRPDAALMQAISHDLQPMHLSARTNTLLIMPLQDGRIPARSRQCRSIAYRLLNFVGIFHYYMTKN